MSLKCSLLDVNILILKLNQKQEGLDFELWKCNLRHFKPDSISNYQPIKVNCDRDYQKTVFRAQ